MITVNGAPRDVPAGGTVAALIAELTGLPPEGRGVAVAVDGEVVPRGAWGVSAVTDGAQVEVVGAVQGG